MIIHVDVSFNFIFLKRDTTENFGNFGFFTLHDGESYTHSNTKYISNKIHSGSFSKFFCDVYYVGKSFGIISATRDDRDCSMEGGSLSPISKFMECGIKEALGLYIRSAGSSKGSSAHDIQIGSKLIHSTLIFFKF
jgi:hypothetical protein